MRNQAGFEASKRHNVYCGYCLGNNYIADLAHNSYSDNYSLKHNFLAAQHGCLVPYNTGKVLIGSRYRPAANTAFKADNQRHFLTLMDERRRESLDSLVTLFCAVTLVGVLIAARWI
jgi:hypothetical protein